VLVVLTFMTLSFAGGYLSVRLRPFPVERVVGTTILNGNTPMVDIDELPSSLISPQTVIAGIEGSECLVPYGEGQRVEVGIIRTAPGTDHTGGDTAVWVKCLSGPDRVDASRRHYELIPEEWNKFYPQAPHPGDTVRYTGITWHGSGSDRLGIPDVAAGMTGQVWGLTEDAAVIVEFENGPTFPVFMHDLEVLED
jgi:hypothetical protein